jgi:uncharacterized protein involved in type VI secretion and phage assembly
MNQAMSQPGAGLYVGTVDSNKLDQDGCIGISIPGLGGTFQARVVAQMAGDKRGIVFLPEKNDHVLVAAVLGSDVKWVVIGSLWSRNEKPPETNGDGENDTKIIKTRGGNVIRLIDKDGDESIEIADKTGKNRISIKTKANTMTIESTEGSISLLAKSIDIQATDGNVTIQGGQVHLN